LRSKHADNVTLESWNIVTTSSGNQITSVMSGEADGLTYTVTVVLTYTAPDDRMKFDYTVTIPAGNTKPVRLYHLIDTDAIGDPIIDPLKDPEPTVNPTFTG